MPPDSGGRPGSAASRGAGLSLPGYASQRLHPRRPSHRDFPSGSGKPDCDERPPGKSGESSGAAGHHPGLFLPASQVPGAGGCHHCGTLHHPASPADAHPGGADSGSLPHQKRACGHRSPQCSAAAAAEPPCPREKGKGLWPDGVPGGRPGDAGAEQL